MHWHRWPLANITFKDLLSHIAILTRHSFAYIGAWCSLTCHFFHDDACLEKTSMELHTQQSSKCILHICSILSLYRFSICDSMDHLPMYQFISGPSPSLWSSAQFSLCFNSNHDPTQNHHDTPSIWFRPVPTTRPLRLLSQINRLVDHLFQPLAYIGPHGKLLVD